MESSPSSKLPKHVAIIMDGNGRWAKEHGLPRVEGHRVGVNQSEEIITCASEMGIGYLTLYAFSSENWQRPQEEVDALMKLLKTFLLEKRQKMLANGIRLRTIGDVSLLPDEVGKTLQSVINDTAVGKGMVLTLALSYGSRDEIVRGFRKAAARIGEGAMVDEKSFGDCLDTAGMPDPDLVIRTSGEYRVSNFLLWQSAYAEFVFEKCHWPDFTRDHFVKAIREYQKRERRYGRVG